MFGFLKDKLKKAIGAFSGAVKKDISEEEVEAPKKVEASKAGSPAVPKGSEKKSVSEAKPAKVETKPVVKPVTTKKESPMTRVAPAAPKPTVKPETPKPAAKAPEPKKVVPQATPKVTEKKTVPETKAKPAVKAPEPPNPGEGKKAGFFDRLFGKKEETAEAVSAASEAVAPEVPDAQEIIEENDQESTVDLPPSVVDTYARDAEIKQEATVKEEPEEKGGFFGKLRDAVTKRTLSPEKFDEIFWELELAMLENNVAVEVIEKIKNDLREELTTGKVSRLDLESQVSARLKQSIEELFDVPTFDLIARIKKAPKPFKLCIIGVNGSGKTTTLAKIVKRLQNNDLSVVVAASDTFRAAAIQQLGEHCERLGVKMISQGYGADPAAVAFDAIKHAESKDIDVVLIDTAGRLHSNTNLMAELEKVVRVAKPDLKLFIGEAITGNDCVEQAKVFDELVGIDAIVLSKADVDEKGGAAISVSYVTGKPILYLGVGQNYDDLKEFDKDEVVGALGL